MEKQAMIFAAGLGTRLKPLTDTMPKALVEVDGKPLLWHVVMKLKEAGYTRVVINVHHFAQQIVDYVAEHKNFGLDIRISDETSALLETGGGIRKALPLLNPQAPVLIHNVDILSNLPLDNLPTDHTTLIVSQRQTTRYLQFDSDMRLVGWKNNTTGEVKGREAQPLAFSGIHVLTPDMFPLLEQWPERFPIMDFYLTVCSKHIIKGYFPDGLQLIDVGKPEALASVKTLCLCASVVK